MGARITLKGLKKAARQIREIQKRIKKVTTDAIDEVVADIVQEARSNAPEDLGELKRSIRSEKNPEQGTVNFFMDAPYAAMMEFGTKNLVDIPAELEEEAAQFRGYKGGDMKQFQRNIEEWCDRKGLDPEIYAYPIMRKILNRGLEPRPFFYPALNKHRDRIPEVVAKRLDELTKKTK